MIIFFSLNFVSVVQARLNVSDVIPAGFLFIWLEKEFLQKVVNIAAGWGFKYVENFCWIKKNINNQIYKGASRYFNKSKLSLLIFRKVRPTGEF